MREQDLGSTIREMLALQTAVEYVQLYFQNQKNTITFFLKQRFKRVTQNKYNVVWFTKNPKHGSASSGQPERRQRNGSSQAHLVRRSQLFAWCENTNYDSN